MATRWHVLTAMGGSPENCWTDDGVPVTFPTRKAAAAELRDHIAACRDAVKAGDMTSAPRFTDFSIERIGQ
jgi:hypothetical protein